MSCRWFHRRTGRYVDEELPPRQREMIARHLETCTACRCEADRLRALAPVLHSLDLPEVPEGLSARILARAERQRAERYGRRPILQTWGMRSAAATVLLLGMAIGSVLGRNTWGYVPSPLATPSPTEDVADVYALDAFESAPPGSLEAGFLAVAHLNGRNP